MTQCSVKKNFYILTGGASEKTGGKYYRKERKKVNFKFSDWTIYISPQWPWNIYICFLVNECQKMKRFTVKILKCVVVSVTSLWKAQLPYNLGEAHHYWQLTPRDHCTVKKLPKNLWGLMWVSEPYTGHEEVMPA